MIRLRFPRAPDAPPQATLPPELRWDAPPESVALLLSRRQFLRAATLVLGTLALPAVRVERTWARAGGRFFTRRERATLEALCDRILPTDDHPGAAALGAPRYIERLLTSLDGGTPRIFAGGPFSNRNPFPNNDTGTPSRRRPRNAFKRFLPLARLQELSWRAELFGSASVPEFAPLDAQLGTQKRGLRDVYREGLAKVDQVAAATKGARFADLPPAEQDEVFGMLDAGAFAPDPRRGGESFVDILIRHTLEGCFAPPEYGGNDRGRGWAMIGLEGDSQPLGYSIFSRERNGYVERPDHPMSTPDPDELAPDGTIVPKPLTPDGEAIQAAITSLTAGFGSGAC